MRTTCARRRSAGPAHFCNMGDATGDMGDAIGDRGCVCVPLPCNQGRPRLSAAAARSMAAGNARVHMAPTGWRGCRAGAHARQDGVFVLDAVRLVDDDVAPVELLEVVLLLRARARACLSATRRRPCGQRTDCSADACMCIRGQRQARARTRRSHTAHAHHMHRLKTG